MIDSCFSHEMTPFTIQGSQKVCIFLSDLLLLGTLNKREVFDKMVKLTKMLVEPRTLKFWHSLRCSIKKNQAVTLMNFVLCTYIHYLCLEFAIYLVLHGASKILPCSSWYK